MTASPDTVRELLRQMSPNVRRAWNHRAVGMKLKPRMIFDYELLYLEKGELRLRIEDRMHTLVPGDILLLKPGVEHEFVGSSGECWMPHIHFDVMDDASFADVPVNFKTRAECSEAELRLVRPDHLGSVLGMPDIIRIGGHGEILRLLMKLIHASDRRDEAFIILQKSLVLHVLHLLLTGLEAQHKAHLSLHEKTLEQAVSFIIEHYNRTVSLEELSKLACLSVFHFSRLFKEKFGLSPQQYQIRQRIEKAKGFMIYGRRSLTSIAEEVGYGSVYAFSKAFKQAEGVSPRQYVRTYLGE